MPNFSEADQRELAQVMKKKNKKNKAHMFFYVFFSFYIANLCFLYYIQVVSKFLFIFYYLF